MSDPPWIVNYLDGKWLAVLSKFVEPVGQSGILEENALTPKLVQPVTGERLTYPIDFKLDTMINIINYEQNLSL